MIKINRTQEPTCLTELKERPNVNYVNDLQEPCKEIVRTQLRADQKGLCAYCQRKFNTTNPDKPKISTFIEHYEAQTDFPEKQLDYDNFFAVCSGKYYVNRKTGKHISFCSKERGSNDLTINPAKETHIDTIYYDDDNKIHSSNPTFENELNDTLKLNFADLLIDREIAFDEEDKIIMEMADELELTPIEAYAQGIRSIIKRNPEFSGLLYYKFERLLEYFESKNI